MKNTKFSAFSLEFTPQSTVSATAAEFTPLEPAARPKCEPSEVSQYLNPEKESLTVSTEQQFSPTGIFFGNASCEDDIVEEIPLLYLQNEWTLYYNAPQSSKQLEWKDSVQKLSTFSTVQGFWQCINNLPAPSELLPKSNFHIFKSSITPEWEDPANLTGTLSTHSYSLYEV